MRSIKANLTCKYIMSAAVVTPLGKVRRQMDTFIETLEEWATNSQRRELEKFKLKFQAGMRTNPRGTVEFFCELVTDHADHIMEGNDAYFLGDGVSVNPEYAGLSNQLKSWWPELDEEQKTFVKKQFKLILMLSAIATKNEDLRLVINKYRDPSNPLLY